MGEEREEALRRALRRDTDGVMEFWLTERLSESLLSGARKMLIEWRAQAYLSTGTFG